MTCQQVQAQLSEYFSDELTPQARQAMAAHLQSCPVCQDEWNKFCEAMAALRSAMAPPPPADLPTRIHAAIALRHRPTAQRRRIWVSVGALSAAAMMLVAILSLLLLRPKPIQLASRQALLSPSIPSSREAPIPASPTLSPPMATTKETPVKPKQLPPRPKRRPPLEVPKQPPPAAVLRRPAVPLLETVPQPAPLAPIPQPPSPLPRQAVPAESSRSATPALAVPSVPGTGEATEAQTSSTSKWRLPAQAGGAKQAFLTVGEGIKVSWERFEPPTLGATVLWRLALTPLTQCHLTLSVQPGDGVEVLNATPQKVPEGGQLLGEGDAAPDKPLTLPILVLAEQEGILRITFVIAGRGQTERWVVLFNAERRPNPLDMDLPIPISQDRWTVQDLLTLLTRQTHGAFLVPEVALQQTVFIPTGRRTAQEILRAVEKSLGHRWHQVGSAFALTAANSAQNR